MFAFSLFTLGKVLLTHLSHQIWLKFFKKYCYYWRMTLALNNPWKCVCHLQRNLAKPNFSMTRPSNVHNPLKIGLESDTVNGKRLDKYWGESKFLQYFDHVWHNSAVPDVSPVVVKVTNYTGLWEVELTWHWPTAEGVFVA